MRVILADDHPDVRSAMRLIIEEKPDVEVVAEVSTSSDLLSQIRSNCPDLVLLDWELPGTRSADLVSLLHALCSHLAVIALSSSPQVKQAALNAGAHEFVCKSDPPESLLIALDHCYQHNSG